MQVATNQLICLLFWRTNQLICLLFFPANGNHGLDRWGMLVSQSHWQIVCRKIGHFAFRYVLIYLFFRENTWPHYQKMIYLSFSPSEIHEIWLQRRCWFFNSSLRRKSRLFRPKMAHEKYGSLERKYRHPNESFPGMYFLLKNKKTREIKKIFLWKCLNNSWNSPRFNEKYGSL